MSRVRTGGWAVAVAVAAGLILASWAGCSKKPGLSVTGMEPTSGVALGNTTVTIHGTGFQEGSAKGVKVLFGNQQARVLGFVDDETLKVETPAGEVGQTVDVLLMFDDARVSQPLKYTYVESSNDFNVDSLVEGNKQAPAATDKPSSQK